MAELYHCVYLSTAAAWLDRAAVERLVAAADRRNWRDDITGTLVCSGGHFLQWIEGAPAPLQALLARLRRDMRHHDLRVLQSGPLPARRFERWGMRLTLDTGFERLCDGLAAGAEPQAAQRAALLAELQRREPTDLNPMRPGPGPARGPDAAAYPGRRDGAPRVRWPSTALGGAGRPPAPSAPTAATAPTAPSAPTGSQGATAPSAQPHGAAGAAAEPAAPRRRHSGA